MAAKKKLDSKDSRSLLPDDQPFPLRSRDCFHLSLDITPNNVGLVISRYSDQESNALIEEG